MASCQLAFGQWTRVTKSCECMVLVQFVPVGIRHMADSIFSRSLFSLVAIKAATFATYLVHTYPQEEDEAEEETKKKKKQTFLQLSANPLLSANKQVLLHRRRIQVPKISNEVCCVFWDVVHKNFKSFSCLISYSFLFGFSFFFRGGGGAVDVSVVVVENQLVLVGRKQQQ